MTKTQAETVARIKAAKPGKSKLKLAAERKTAGTDATRRLLAMKPVKALKRPTKASSEPHRTARVRYIEKPTHSDGNPFFAFRVRDELGKAFRTFAKKKGQSPSALLRSYMSKVTGVDVSDSDGEE